LISQVTPYYPYYRSVSLAPSFDVECEGEKTDMQVENPVDETAEQLRTIGESGSHPDGDKVTKDLQKRKLIAPK
jgi:hypothetical protein